MKRTDLAWIELADHLSGYIFCQRFVFDHMEGKT